jgi:hypothetical protein
MYNMEFSDPAKISQAAENRGPQMGQEPRRNYLKHNQSNEGTPMGAPHARRALLELGETGEDVRT